MDPVKKDIAAREAAQLRRMLQPLVIVGGLIIAMFFGGLGGWAATAPLSSAAVASGVISPKGSRRAVQHLEGGIIKEIMVKEGSEVAAGQPLIVLHDTQAKAQFQANQSTWLRLMAIKARLTALQADQAELDLSSKLETYASADPEYQAFLDSQRDLFRTKKQGHEGRKSVLETQRQQLIEQLEGVKAERVGNDRQLELITSELDGLLGAPPGTIRKSRIMEMQRMQAEVSSKTANSRASIASVKQKVAEVDLAIINAENEYRDKLADEIMRINAELAQVTERVVAGRDVLTRTVISAPVDGIVADMKFKTLGGVIKPGDVLMHIVPTKEDLVIDARLQPIDRDVVLIGQTAQVNLLAYVQRNLPILEGEVTFVSADTLTDERTGEPFYETRISIDRAKLDAVAPNIDLAPGMPADVLILTGARPTVLYIFEPILRSLNRAFRQE